ncbi:MAG: patatin-like phospholipase family protein [Candidatus Krumholzibacteriota bacterium]
MDQGRIGHPHLALIPVFILGILLASIPIDLAGAEETAAEDQTADRPRIGLCLGGGGARGAAHIGVLQILKEMNVPIDYVAGTSMGSIVGALYAIGMQPEEIESIVVGVDWDDLFSDRPERTQRILRRKQDDSAAFIPVEWGWRNGIVMSSGVVAGQKLAFAFRSPALYLSGHHGFDELPYPYRAVTTNLQTGEMFVPDKGNLIKAVRASMSIPGVFPPVDWGGMKLVDGFLARNLPVDVVRAMGADIVIAVDVGALPENTPPENIKTLMGVTAQAAIIGARQNVDPQLLAADIIIQPDLTGISSREFKRVAETLAPGRRAAEAVADQLEALSVNPAAYRAHLEAHAPQEIGELIIGDIVLVNHTRVHDKAILRNIRQQIGQELDLDLLKNDLADLYDFGVFELVDFELEQVGDELVLVINTIEKYHSPNIINFGVSYEGGEGGKSDIEARMRWTRLEMNRFGAELRTDVQLGKNSLVKSEYYQPLTWRRIPFFALTGNAEMDIKDWYFQSRHWGEYKTTEFSIKPELGIRLGHFGEFRAGLEYGHLDARDKTGLSLTEFKGAGGGYSAQLVFDMFDLAILPRHGFEALVQVSQKRPEFGSGLDFAKLNGGLAGAHTFGTHTLYAALEGGTAMKTNLPEFAMFTLGGLSRLSGYAKDQFRGSAYGLAKVAWYHQFAGSLSPFSNSYYLGVQLETGNAWRYYDEARWDDLLFGGLVSLVARTNLGPLAATYGRSEDGHDSFYLTLGTIDGFLD